MPLAELIADAVPSSAGADSLHTNSKLFHDDIIAVCTAVFNSLKTLPYNEVQNLGKAIKFFDESHIDRASDLSKVELSLWLERMHKISIL
jgi:hypothetical protein